MPGFFFAHELYPLTVRWRSSFILQARWKCEMPGHHLISTLCQGVAKTFSNSWHLLKSSSFVLFNLISLALVTIVYIYIYYMNNTVLLSVPWHFLFRREATTGAHSFNLCILAVKTGLQTAMRSCRPQVNPLPWPVAIHPSAHLKAPWADGQVISSL